MKKILFLLLFVATCFTANAQRVDKLDVASFSIIEYQELEKSTMDVKNSVKVMLDMYLGAGHKKELRIEIRNYETTIMAFEFDESEIASKTVDGKEFDMIECDAYVRGKDALVRTTIIADKLNGFIMFNANENLFGVYIYDINSYKDLTKVKTEKF